MGQLKTAMRRSPTDPTVMTMEYFCPKCGWMLSGGELAEVRKDGLALCMSCRRREYHGTTTLSPDDDQ